MRLRLLDDTDSPLWDDALPETTFRVGTAAPADLILPRARFVELARVEFELTPQGDALLFRHLGKPRPCVVDGKSLREGTLSAGRHLVELGPVRLTLVVEPD